MNEEDSSRLATELAKALIELARSVDPRWEKAFYRFESDGSNVKTNGSYAVNGEARIFDVLQHKPTFALLRSRGEELRDSLEKDGKKFLVCLLSVDAAFDFDISYDYENPERWKISKFAGGTGFPQP